MLSLRVRHSGGSCSLTVPSDGLTLPELLRLVAANLDGTPPAALLFGFPPAPLTDVSALRSGDTLQVLAADTPTAAPAETRLTPPPEAPPAPPAAPPAAPNCVPLPSGDVLVRRSIADDNSCMFNAVGYCIEHSRARAPDLRRLVAEAVHADPATWSEAVLGKSNEEYQRWIQLPLSWGGAIELSILAAHYGIEIWAADIQTCRVDRYGEGSGFSERCWLMYDGLHYDALAVAPSADAPEEFDTTQFPVAHSDIDDAAADLVKKHHDAHRFTDTASFSLRCLVCRAGLKGQIEAVAHAKATGHSSFGEYL